VIAVATALEPLTHLPEIRSISAFNTEFLIRLKTDYDPWLKFEPLSQWAYAFNAPIEIALDYGTSADVNARFEMAGHQVCVTERMNSAHAYQLGAELQTPFAQGQPLQMTAAKLQELIHKFAVQAATS